MNLRVKFLRSQLSKQDFLSKLFALEEKSNLAEHEAELVIGLIGLVNDLQYLVAYKTVSAAHATDFLKD